MRLILAETLVQFCDQICTRYLPDIARLLAISNRLSFDTLFALQLARLLKELGVLGVLPAGHIILTRHDRVNFLALRANTGVALLIRRLHQIGKLAAVFLEGGHGVLVLTNGWEGCSSRRHLLLCSRRILDRGLIKVGWLEDVLTAITVNKVDRSHL